MELMGEFDPKKIESLVAKRRKGTDAHKIEAGKGEEIIFIEGPPTMNGVPHAGHLRGRVIKDLWYRYNILCGRRVIFNAGWDTQGLPVELQAQKEMGISGTRTDLAENVGIEKMVSKCKEIVQRYSKRWMRVDDLLGMSLDQEKAYWTYRDDYIQREWQFLKKANETGVLQDDYTVIAYCPSCQTSLSHAEVNQGYEEVSDPSLYYTAKLADEDAHLVVWTTMPFTLVTDAMVGLNPEEDYCYIRVNGAVWIVGKTRMEEFLEQAGIAEYEMLKSTKGSELGGKKYIHPLQDCIPKLGELAQEQNYHVTVSEEFVDRNSGSGLVHLSPANGEEDIAIANRRGVVIFNPINDEVVFTEDAGKYAGMFVRDADDVIVNDLKERGALVKIGSIRHKYPLCWRSRHRIVWLARRGWFYKLDRLGAKAIEAAESVEYFYEQPRNRFLGIVRERHPWCISRERFWGCPIPAWNCKCGHRTWLYAREEIIAAAASLPDGENFELHRPWIDNVVIRCAACSGTETQREPFVLDTWHNSGAAPYASLDDRSYAKHIPAPFFTEGIDQTRGWAYTLLVENVILNDAPVPPFRSFLFQGHVLDKNGGKMSKSLGNVIDAEELLEKHPADMIRFYFMWKSSPIESLSFSIDEMMSRPYQILSTLYHTHHYFKQNSEYDGFGAVRNRAENLLAPDIWILSKLQKLILKADEYNSSCKFHESARSLEEFIIGDLSQTYIPITRNDLWKDDEESKARRMTIYATLYRVLETLDLLIHPFCPFTSEYLYQRLPGKKHTILQDRWPQSDKSLINNDIEEAFDLIEDAASVSAAARMKRKLKRRWPLKHAHICVAPGQRQKLEVLSDLIAPRLNVTEYSVTEITMEQGLDGYLQMREQNLPVRPVLEMKRKRIGPKAKERMPALLKIFAQTDPELVISGLKVTGTYAFGSGDAKIVLDADDFTVGFEAKDGYVAAERGDCMVFLHAERTEEMRSRGLIKDIARRLQELRKKRGHNPAQVLSVASILRLSAKQQDMMTEMQDELKFLVRVKKISFERVCDEYVDTDVDGQNIQISIE